MFNAFNHPSFGPLTNNNGANLTSGQFGQVTTYEGNARQIQIVVKASF
jgi:hypothetical protein